MRNRQRSPRTSASDPPKPLPVQAPAGDRVDDARAEELVRHELVMRIVELRQENYFLREQLREKTLKSPDVDQLKARIEKLSAQLAAVSWAESLVEAQQAARDGLTS